VKIGELARSAGVGTQTIRFYEREGLLAAPERSASGYRCYTPDAVRSVRNIRALQAIGFTLNDIMELFELEQVLAGEDIPLPMKSSARSLILERVKGRLSMVEERIGNLSRMKDELEQLIAVLANSGGTRGFVLPTEVAGLRRLLHSHP
jgi:MerR family mercuric resistance operon transcriptional regulator